MVIYSVNDYVEFMEHAAVVDTFSGEEFEITEKDVIAVFSDKGISVNHDETYGERFKLIDKYVPVAKRGKNRYKNISVDDIISDGNIIGTVESLPRREGASIWLVVEKDALVSRQSIRRKY